MQVAILTIFPELFQSFLDASLVKKAIDRSLLHVTLINIRDYASPPHYQVDDTPYGGGPGMVMRPEPLAGAIAAARLKLPSAPVILLSPSGKPFVQDDARELSTSSEIILVCGRYEGVDQRVIDLAVDREISIGDYILMGGELPAMVVIESVLRLRPGVLGNESSTESESFSTTSGMLEAPHYTRPAEFQGHQVPEVLLSGNHALIEKWRLAQGQERTLQRRPDLLSKGKQ